MHCVNAVKIVLYIDKCKVQFYKLRCFQETYLIYIDFNKLQRGLERNVL